MGLGIRGDLLGVAKVEIAVEFLRFDPSGDLILSLELVENYLTLKNEEQSRDAFSGPFCSFSSLPPP